METPLIAHRCGRAYGPDSSRQALRAALAGGPLRGVETDVCLTRDGALACLHDAYLPVGTTLTGWAHERRAADVLAGRLLDREGERPPSDRCSSMSCSTSSRPGSRCRSTSKRTPTRRWRGARSTRSPPSWRGVLTQAG